MLRRQTGDQPQDRALAAAAGPQDADEFPLVGQVLDEEAHVADRRVLVRQAGVVGLRHVAELDDPREAVLLRLREAIDDLAHADGRGDRGGLRSGRSGVLGVHDGFPPSPAVLRSRTGSRLAPAGTGRQLPPACGTSAAKSSHARQIALTPRCKQAVAAVLVGEQLALHPEQQPVDRQGHQGNEHQHQQDIGAVAAAALAEVDDASQPAHVLRLDDLGQHDVAERQPEQQPQRVENARHGQRHQDLHDDLPAAGAQGVGGIHVAAADVRDGRGGVHDDERHAGDEDEHDLLELADAEQRKRQGDHGRHGDIAADDHQRREEGADAAETAAEHAQRNAHHGRQPKPEQRRASG